MSHKIKWIEGTPVLHLYDGRGNYAQSQNITKEEAYRIAAGMNIPCVKREPLTESEIRAAMERLEVIRAARDAEQEKIDAWREEQLQPDWDEIFRESGISPNPAQYPVIMSSPARARSGRALYIGLYVFAALILIGFFLRVISSQ